MQPNRVVPAFEIERLSARHGIDPSVERLKQIASLRLNVGEAFTFLNHHRYVGEEVMTQNRGNFALIGRSYPGEAFELLSQEALSAPERRKIMRVGNRARELEWSKRVRQAVSRA